jgi:ubiquinone/menaquinone biosynthesis C-methylase UbiE
VASPDLIALAAAALHVDRDPERVLVTECGDAERCLFLAREFPRARIRGVDRDEERVREATSRVGLDPEGRIAFKHAPRGRLPFPDDHFDLVVRRPVHGAWEQVAASRDRREIARVLRPGAELIVVSEGRRARTVRGFETVHEGGAGGGTYLVARVP